MHFLCNLQTEVANTNERPLFPPGGGIFIAKQACAKRLRSFAAQQRSTELFAATAGFEMIAGKRVQKRFVVEAGRDHDSPPGGGIFIIFDNP